MHQHLLISLMSSDSLLLFAEAKPDRSYFFSIQSKESSRPQKNVVLSAASSCQPDNMTTQALVCDGHSIS